MEAERFALATPGPPWAGTPPSSSAGGLTPSRTRSFASSGQTPPTAGLAEGTSDFAILRRVPDTATVALVLIGLEKRFCAMAADDELAGKRSITLAQAGTAPVAMDLRTGSTRLDLWPEGQQPARTIPTDDADDWLTVIAGGKARGITAESTAHQYRRKGVVYRPVRDAAPVPVYAAWTKADPPAGVTGVVELLAGLYS
ncbi:MAG: LysR family transcriptional regulator [Pseudarthrobacter sp.]|nr:LysR family transcriptional regulator [Pseudarthrobacter sp.]